MARKPRHLSPEERALWDRVAQQAEPLHQGALPAPTEVQAAPLPKFAGQGKAQPVAPFSIGAKVDHRKDHDLLPSLSQSLGAEPLRMDARAHGKLRRGKLKPEARIDLHGMTLAEAHPALRSFVLSEFAAGSRLVLVITGKGKLRDYEAPMPVRQGVLRHQVPQWLRLPPLAQVVLQVTPANQRHGGEGAYYVYLRRRG